MKRVILVYPKVGYYDSITNNIPYSFLFLASNLKGFDVKLIDQRVEKEWEKRLLRLLNKDVICVSVSAMTGPQIKYALEISKFVKKHSEVTVVWGEFIQQ